MLDLLFMLSGSALAVSFLLHSATKGEIKKDNELQRVSTKNMLEMRKVTRQIMSVSGAVLSFAFSINLSSPSNDTGVPETTAVEAAENWSYWEEARTRLNHLSSIMKGIAINLSGV